MRKLVRATVVTAIAGLTVLGTAGVAQASEKAPAPPKSAGATIVSHDGLPTIILTEAELETMPTPTEARPLR